MDLALLDHPCLLLWVGEDAPDLIASCQSLTGVSAVRLCRLDELAQCRLASSMPTLFAALNELDDDLPKPSSASKLALMHHQFYSDLRFSEVGLIVFGSEISYQSVCWACQTLPAYQPIVWLGQASHSNDQSQTELTNVLWCPQATTPWLTLIEQGLNQLVHQRSRQCCQALKLAPPPLLKEPGFKRLFTELLLATNSVEYYLADLQGSFILINQQGQVSYLLVKSETMQVDYFQRAKKYGLPGDLLDAIALGEKLPLFDPKLSEEALAWGEWASQLVPAKTLALKQKMFYAVVKGGELFEVLSNRVVSYQAYRLAKGEGMYAKTRNIHALEDNIY